MLTTKSAVYLHIPKTAGVWVNDTLAPITQSLLMHGIPQDRPARDHVFVFARNPWNWYVSFYQFHISGSEMFHNSPASCAVLSALTTLTDLSFPDFIRHVNEPTIQFRKRTELMMKISHDLSSDYHSADAIIHGSWINSDASYFQHMYRLFTCFATKVGTVENLQGDLLGMLDISGEMTPELEYAIMNKAPMNVSHNKPDYRSYYTDDLIDVVARNNRQIIDAHGYKFE